MTNDLHMPDIGLPVGGSDYHRFVAYSGIPSLDLKMESSPGASYPLYHTMRVFRNIYKTLLSSQVSRSPSRNLLFQLSAYCKNFKTFKVRDAMARG